jgi:hypothetical protein
VSQREGRWSHRDLESAKPQHRLTQRVFRLGIQSTHQPRSFREHTQSIAKASPYVSHLVFRYQLFPCLSTQVQHLSPAWARQQLRYRRRGTFAVEHPDDVAVNKGCKPKNILWQVSQVTVEPSIPCDNSSYTPYLPVNSF